MSSRPAAELLDLSGQVALITGASKGIGRGIAEVFHQAGAKLTLVARTSGPLKEVAERLSRGSSETTVLAVPADVADEQQVNGFVLKTVETFGRLDILVNNAGILHPGRYSEIGPEDWERLMGINLTGAYLCSRAAAPIMEKQKNGRIINIASISGQTGGASGGLHYAASKAGMMGMAKALSRDLAPYNVTVNTITPGVIDTEGQGFTPEKCEEIAKGIPLGRVGTPEDIAYAALFLASPMASYITGAIIDINGGLLKR